MVFLVRVITLAEARLLDGLQAQAQAQGRARPLGSDNPTRAG